MLGMGNDAFGTDKTPWRPRFSNNRALNVSSAGVKDFVLTDALAVTGAETVEDQSGKHGEASQGVEGLVDAVDEGG